MHIQFETCSLLFFLSSFWIFFFTFNFLFVLSVSRMPARSLHTIWRCSDILAHGFFPRRLVALPSAVFFCSPSFLFSSAHTLASYVRCVCVWVRICKRCLAIALLRTYKFQNVARRTKLQQQQINAWILLFYYSTLFQHSAIAAKCLTQFTKRELNDANNKQKKNRAHSTTLSTANVKATKTKRNNNPKNKIVAKQCKRIHISPYHMNAVHSQRFFSVAIVDLLNFFSLAFSFVRNVRPNTGKL